MSFPSGHAEFAVTFYGFLTYLALRRVTGVVPRVAMILAWLAFAGVIGFGRVSEGRHWPLDVIAAYVVGIGLLSGLIWLRNAFCRASDLPPGRRPALSQSSHMRTSLGTCNALK